MNAPFLLSKSHREPTEGSPGLQRAGVLWLLNLGGRWHFMEDIQYQKTNDGEQKSLVSLAVFSASPQGVVFPSPSIARTYSDISTSFFHLWRMGWSVQSLRGSWVTGFFVLILIYSHTTQGKLYLDFWNQVFLGTSWTWLSLVIFSPSCLLLYIILYYFELFNVFGGLCSFYTLERTKITGTTERKHFYRLSKSLHAQEELRKKKKRRRSISLVSLFLITFSF